MGIISRFPGGVGGGSSTLDDVTVLVCDFSTCEDVIVIDGHWNDDGKEIIA